MMIIILLGICLISPISVEAQCSVSVSDVQNTNGIVTYNDEQGRPQLLLSPTVPTGVSLNVICSPQESHQFRCERNGRFRPALRVSCTQAPLPTVRMGTGSSCPAPANMYQVGHFVGNRFLELYRSCFDPVAVRAYFSEAALYAKQIFPPRPNCVFTGDGIVTPNQAASYIKGNIYNRFRSIYGPNQRYITDRRQLVINRGHLTASADFLFSDQMCGTFKYINMVPQFQSINDGNWETIERWVRSRIPQNSALHVRTGAIGVLALPNTPQGQLRDAYLRAGNQNPIPQWMYKVVWNANSQPLYAFLTYNNIYATAQPNNPNFCQVVACPMQLIQTAAAGYTFCCDPANFAV